MKRLSVIKNKISNLFIRALAALSLGVVLQADHCIAWPSTISKIEHGQYYNMVKALENPKDIGKDYNKNTICGEEDTQGNTFLYATLVEAIESRDFSKLKELLEYYKKLFNESKNINIPDFINAFHKKTGYTPLGRAIKSGNLELCKLLFYQSYIDVNKAKLVKIDNVRYNKSDRINMSIKQANLTSLLLSILNKREKIAKLLLDHPNIDFRTTDPASGSTPLCLAISNNLTPIALSLISKLSEEDLKLENKQGESPLYLAVKGGLKSVAKELVHKLPAIQVSVYNGTKKYNLLHMVIQRRWQDIAFSMIDKLKAEDLSLNHQGETALSLAIEYNLQDVAEKLISKLPAITRFLHEKSDQKDLLDMGIKHGDKWQHITKSLIAKLPDKDLTLTNKESETPLCLAVKNDLGIVVDSLLPRLFSLEDFFSKHKKKKGPLHLAARNNNPTTLRKIAERIYELAGKDYNKLIDMFFNKDAHGYTVFASAFLPRNKTERLIHIRNHNSDMFKDVLRYLKGNLTKNHCNDIINEINTLEIKRTINQKYANALRITVADLVDATTTTKDNLAVKHNSVISSEGTPLIAAAG